MRALPHGGSSPPSDTTFRLVLRALEPPVGAGSCEPGRTRWLVPGPLCCLSHRAVVSRGALGGRAAPSAAPLRPRGAGHMGDHQAAAAVQQQLVELHADRIASGVLVCDPDGDHRRLQPHRHRDPRPRHARDRRPVGRRPRLAAGRARSSKTVGRSATSARRARRAGRRAQHRRRWSSGRDVDGQGEPALAAGLRRIHLPPDEQGLVSRRRRHGHRHHRPEARRDALRDGRRRAPRRVARAARPLLQARRRGSCVIDFNIGSGFDAFITSDDFLGRRPEEFLPAEVAARHAQGDRRRAAVARGRRPSRSPSRRPARGAPASRAGTWRCPTAARS